MAKKKKAFPAIKKRIKENFLHGLKETDLRIRVVLQQQL
jgi:hypothetical protein